MERNDGGSIGCAILGTARPIMYSIFRTSRALTKERHCLKLPGLFCLVNVSSWHGAGFIAVSDALLEEYLEVRLMSFSGLIVASWKVVVTCGTSAVVYGVLDISYDGVLRDYSDL